MKGIHFYIVLSLFVHIALFWCLRLPKAPTPEVRPNQALVFEFNPPEPHASPSPTPMSIAPKPTVAPEPHASPSPTPMPIAPKPTRPEPQPEAPANAPAHPERSILFSPPRERANRSFLGDPLPDFATLSTPLSGKELVKKRLKEFSRDFQRQVKPRNGNAPQWLYTTAQAAAEGAAFYAAASSSNAPAMLAVVGLSLTGSMLRKGVNKAASALKHLGHSDGPLGDRDAFLAAQIAQQAPISVHDLYLSLPPGWTFGLLQQHLDTLVGRGLIARDGKGTKAFYHMRN